MKTGIIAYWSALVSMKFPGVKYRTQFNILLSRESGIWWAEIVKVKRKKYLPKIHPAVGFAPMSSGDDTNK
jgi:hypothetical protein